MDWVGFFLELLQPAMMTVAGFFFFFVINCFARLKYLVSHALTFVYYGEYGLKYFTYAQYPYCGYEMLDLLCRNR